MKNCINCGHSLELNVKFCPECGSKQPDQPQEDKNPVYSANIGDKNVISGNIIGKSEEFNISGPATINKIEDDTKKFITCAVSGKHLLRGRDIVVNCPKCKSDVAQDCFDQSAGRCFNCDKQAYSQYSNKLDLILSDGIIDASERIQLDAFALSLMIDSSAKQKLESEAKERKANLNLNTIGGNSSELSGFYKIQFKKAVALLFENNDLSGAVNLLTTIHKENVLHDETASLLFLAKALQYPEAYANDYEKKSERQIDVYWEDFWAFIPYVKLERYDYAFKIINQNKARFSDNKNDVLLSEVIVYVLLYVSSKEIEYLNEAKSIYKEFGKNVKQPLLVLYQFINTLLDIPDREWGNMSEGFGTQEKFFFHAFLGVNKAAPKEIEPQREKKEEVISEPVEELKSNPITYKNDILVDFDIDENGNCWLDESLRLRARHNRLFFVDVINGIEYPTLITNRAIWLSKNLELTDWWENVIIHGTRNIQDYLPAKWYLPSCLDWSFLASFIASNNGHSHQLNAWAIEINNDQCTLGDKLVCIDSGNSQLLSNGNEYILVNHDGNNIYLYDILNKKYLTQPGSSKLAPLGRKRFKLNTRWNTGMYIVPVPVQDYSYIHPKYPIANKFGIDYNKTGYVTLIIDDRQEKALGDDYGRLVVTKNDGVNLHKLLDGAMEDKNPIRILTPITKALASRLAGMNFTLPDYLAYDDLVLADRYPHNISSQKIPEPKDSQVHIEVSTRAKHQIINIGRQIWMNQNLNVDRFRNGDPIPEAKSALDWELAGKQSKPAWCYYNNNPKNGASYGKLYNWHAVNDPRGLAPDGFHIPSFEEANELLVFTGVQVDKYGDYTFSKALRSKFLLNGTNDTAFSAVLAGRRDSVGRFQGLNVRTGFWTSAENVYEDEGDYINDGLILHLDLINEDTEYDSFWDVATSWSKGYGYSVRCLSD
jgi:uncharacterized protein (TIGR02145 family)